MLHRSSWIVVILLVVAALQLAGCSGTQDAGAGSEEPATVEKTDGSEYERVILTQHADDRLAIETEAVSEQGEQLVIPYSAVLYGINGETWVYVSPESLNYVRTPITVDVIEGDLAMLTEGPPVGTDVVSVGAQMLLGAGTGVGK